MRYLDTILELIFPSSCLACTRRGSDLCNACLASLPLAERECAEWIFPLFDYRHPSVKGAIFLFKYKGRKRLAKILGQALYERMLEELSNLKMMQNFEGALLVPIPLSRKRLRERGFNQAQLLAEEISKLDGGTNFGLEKDVLKRPKDSEHQAHIKDKKGRLKNASGAFAVNNIESVKGKNIILIDDVVTTGATLHEAKRVLRQAGAKKVVAFTVAH